MADVVACLLLDLFDDLGDLLHSLRWRGWTLEEFSKLLALFFGVGRVPRVVRRLAEEEIRYENLVLVLLVGVCQDIGTLQGLVTEAEYVVDEQDGRLC